MQFVSINLLASVIGPVKSKISNRSKLLPTKRAIF